MYGIDYDNEKFRDELREMVEYIKRTAQQQ
jgi:hypothetical protein